VVAKSAALIADAKLGRARFARPGRVWSPHNRCSCVDGERRRTPVNSNTTPVRSPSVGHACVECAGTGLVQRLTLPGRRPRLRKCGRCHGSGYADRRGGRIYPRQKPRASCNAEAMSCEWESATVRLGSSFGGAFIPLPLPASPRRAVARFLTGTTRAPTNGPSGAVTVLTGDYEATALGGPRSTAATNRLRR
jgi:hypothetical protein